METLRRLMVALVWALYLGVWGLGLAIFSDMHRNERARIMDELHLYAIGGIVLHFTAMVLHEVINLIMMKDEEPEK